MHGLFDIKTSLFYLKTKIIEKQCTDFTIHRHTELPDL